jgi:hypothetical protein
VKKLIPILVIIFVSLFIARAAWSLPNCSGNNSLYWNMCYGVKTLYGSSYIGEFKNGGMHGQGTFTYDDGASYDGEWRNSKKHGQGILVMPDFGTEYIGSFWNGNMHGQGTLTWEGYKYIGEFKDDWMDGEYKLIYPDGTIKEGIGKALIIQNLISQQSQTDEKKKSKPSSKDEVFSAASGSGFAVTSSGYVVTNYHVIEGCTDVKIHDKGKAIQATLVTFDPNNDLALLKGDFKPRSFYPLSRKTPELLMDIYVAGYPFGQDMSTSVKVTQGIISSLTGVANNFSNLQIDAALQPGNSGGPIMNNKGNVVGVAVAKLDLEKIVDNYGVVPENVNFGVKSNLVINILESENIKLLNPNADTIPNKELVKLITEGTYYLSCWMTLAQIEKMQETKVMFKDL